MTGRDPGHPFRSSRIVEIEREAATFTYPSKAEYDPDRLFANSFGVFVGAEYPVDTVHLKLSLRWAVFVEHHRWHRTHEVARCADHVAVRMRVRVCRELEAWILGFGEQVEVVGPASLRRAIRAGFDERLRRIALETSVEHARGWMRRANGSRGEVRGARDGRGTLATLVGRATFPV